MLCGGPPNRPPNSKNARRESFIGKCPNGRHHPERYSSLEKGRISKTQKLLEFHTENPHILLADNEMSLEDDTYTHISIITHIIIQANMLEN
jgi:hypothetical protein